VSFQQFCTLYVFCLTNNLFCSIHLQAFNVISVVVYHSGPMFGQVLYSCQDAFIVDAPDYSDHSLDTTSMLLKCFPRKGLFNFGGTSQSLVGSCLVCFAGGEALAINTFPKFLVLHVRHEAAHYCAEWGHRLQTWTFFGKSLDTKHLAET
jgi:hypothetical protein